MELCPNKITKISFTNQSQTESESKSFHNDQFAEIVRKFIERIGSEVLHYENYGSKISENDFQLIEMQKRAQSVENVLNLCIKKVNLMIYLASLIQNRKESLILLFARKHVEKLVQFSKKCFNRLRFRPFAEFNSDLDECLDILGKYVSSPQKIVCIGHGFALLRWNIQRLFDYICLY